MIEDVAKKMYKLTPIGTLAVALEGDMELAEKCMGILRDEACRKPLGNNQTACVAFFPDGPEFEVVDMWDGDHAIT